MYGKLYVSKNSLIYQQFTQIFAQSYIQNCRCWESYCAKNYKTNRNSVPKIPLKKEDEKELSHTKQNHFERPLKMLFSKLNKRGITVTSREQKRAYCKPIIISKKKEVEKVSLTSMVCMTLVERYERGGGYLRAQKKVSLQ